MFDYLRGIMVKPAPPAIKEGDKIRVQYAPGGIKASEPVMAIVKDVKQLGAGEITVGLIPDDGSDVPLIEYVDIFGIPNQEE